MKSGKLSGLILPLLLWGCLSIIASAHAQSPSIVVPPASQSSAVGGTIQFTVSATGGGTLFYQWRKNSTNLANGTFSGRATVSGATTTTMTLAGVTTNDQANYTCYITNTTGSITSSVASLSIFVAPAITTQPGSYNTNTGASVTFSVTASGTAPLSYQWYDNGSPISGATLSSYNLSGLLTSDSGTYNVRVSNAAGNATSSNAVLNVGIAPAITGQPSSLTVLQGQSATFSVTASGTPLNYFWKKNGSFITGKTNATFTIASVVSTDAATYTCQVSNFLGNVTSSGATLTFGAPATITSQPQPQAVAVGSSASFNVSASGTAPISYQWYQNGLLLAGANQRTLGFNPAATTNAGSYYVSVANAFGTNNSTTVSLTVGMSPAITMQPQSLIVTQGQTATFTAAASGDLPLGFFWSANGLPIAGATNLSFSITNAQPADAGTYDFTAINSFGSASSTDAVLTVYYPPTIYGQPAGQTVGVGTDMALSVGADGNPLAYQWRLNGLPVSGATNLTYEVAVAQTNNSGNYDVIVSNFLGSVTSSVAVVSVVYYPPAIITQPFWNNYPNQLGGSYNMVQVNASGSLLAYQWLKNGNVLPGANGASLELNDLGVNDSGDYSVVITNLLGSVTSSVANLSIHYISSQPVGGNVLAGRNFTFNVSAQGDSLAYQWLKNNVIVPNANGTSFSLTNVALSDAGNYTVVVTNYNGSETSSVAALYVGYAPAITQQPASTTNAFGSTVILSVSATGPLPMTYQWLHNSTNLPGQTSSVLTLTNFQLRYVGNYYVIVGNAFGSITSTVVVLHISPGIVTQPTNQTVMPGSAIGFTALANGEQPLTYQWQLNGTNLTDNSTYSGSLSTSLNLVAVLTNTVGNYSLLVSNSYGIVTSSVATLNFGYSSTSLYNYTGQSQLYNVPTGVTNVGLFIVGANNSLEYDGSGGAAVQAIGTVAVLPHSNLLLSVGGGASGYQGGTCPIAGFGGGNGGQAYGGGGGSATLITMPDAGYIIVGGAGGMGGDNFSLSGQASVLVYSIGTNTSGGDGWSYGSTWGFGGGGGGGGAVGGIGGASDYNGTGGGSLLPATYLEQGCAWSFSSANSKQPNGSITIVANPIPYISQQPVSQTPVAGSAAQFNIVVSSPVPLSYQWYFNGAAIPNGSNSNISFSAVTPQNTGAYFVIITNAYASVTSSVVTLTVNIPAYFTSQPQSQTVLQGGTATFGAVATGTPSLGYRWLKQQTNRASATSIVSGGFFLGANIVNGGTGYLAQPNVVISGGGGSGALVTATVNSGVVTAINVINPGSGYTSLPAITIDPPTTPLSGQTNSTLNITGATTSDAGNYFVVVTNGYGSATSSVVSLTVNVPVYIITQPQNQTVPSGSNARFSVTTGGNAPFNYQWYAFPSNNTTATATALVLNGFVYGATITSGGAGYAGIPNVQFTGGGGSGAAATAVVSNGIVVSLNVTNPGTGYASAPLIQIDPPAAVTLNGSTNQALNIVGVSTNDAGVYFVVVANAYGSVTSTQAVLTVVPVIAGTAPTITNQPVSQNVLVGHSAMFIVSATGTPTLGYQWQKNGFNLPTASLSNYSIPSTSTNDTGLYLVIVTNGYGSATSSIASLVVGLPPQKLNINSASGNGVHMQMSGTPNFPYAVQFATNLAPPILWLPVLTNAADTNGLWQFTDTNLNNGQKFYRVTAP